MPEVRAPVPMYLFTGFLGSGKTTLLNRLIERLPGKNLGIVVNDFGDLPVDSAFLHKEPNVLRVTELNGGQIFCSCLSGSFVQQVASYASLPVDCLFIECSGLAKPTPMMDIVNQALELSGGAFEYRGMICLLDAESYEDMADIVNAVDEQMFFSDCFVINKVDRAEPVVIRRLRERIRRYHAAAPIYETAYARVDLQVLHFKSEAAALSDELCAAWKGWGEKGRPYACTFRSPGAVSETALRRFLERMAPDTFRIKGIVPVKTGPVRVDCVGPDIRVEPDEDLGGLGGIVLISKIGAQIKPAADQAWLEVAQTA